MTAYRMLASKHRSKHPMLASKHRSKHPMLASKHRTRLLDWSQQAQQARSKHHWLS